MSSDPEDFEDYEEPPEESLEGILVRMLVREFKLNNRLQRENKERSEIIEHLGKMVRETSGL